MSFPWQRRFLDIGCGPGYLLQGFDVLNENNNMSYQINGVDYSKYAFDLADETVRDRIKVTDIMDFFTKAGVYDVLVSWGGLEYMEIAKLRHFLRFMSTRINYALYVGIKCKDSDDNKIFSKYQRIVADKAWWDTLFKETGWTQDKIFKKKQKLANQDLNIKDHNYTIFIYRSTPCTAKEKKRKKRRA
jgi:cyclopropane fatty-acyl-phospholipid synthase-like methyltransferase